MEKSFKKEIWRLIDARVVATWPQANRERKTNDPRFKDLKRAVKHVCDLAWTSYAGVLRTRTYFD